MCHYLQAEVILANYLSKKDVGVTRKELLNYCREVRNRVKENERLESECILFDIADESLERAIRIYKDIFFEKGRKIYRNNGINIDYFNSRLVKEISDTLTMVADENTEIQTGIN